MSDGGTKKRTSGGKTMTEDNHSGDGLPKMPALSIRQPWAWLILHAGKDVENRTWKTYCRGRVMIHAGKAWGPGEREAREIVMREFGVEIPDRLALGGLVGTVEIVDCVDTSDSRWFVGPFGFVLRNPKPFPFVACRGSLGFFRPATENFSRGEKR